MRDARTKVAGLDDGFRYHDLRHYFASLLISDGGDIKTVQTRLRHGSATTTFAHVRAPVAGQGRVDPGHGSIE
jgi:integrase